MGRIADRLLELSTEFARSSVKAYAAESWETFYLHLATAVEHLMKAVLSRAHPALIADPKDFDALLHLTGLGAKAHKRIETIRTISAGEAQTRVARIAAEYSEPGTGVLQLLEMRNAIVHLGHDPRAQVETILADVARYAAPLLRGLGTDDATYWGDEWDIVSQHVERRLTALEAAYQRRLQAAKARYKEIVDGMSDAAEKAYIAAVDVTEVSEDFDEFPYECPACGNLGALRGDPNPNWEPDYDVEGSSGEGYIIGRYVDSIALSVSEFVCGACRLTLDGDVLPVAGLAQLNLDDDAFDLSEATDYFERLDQDDALIEAYIDDYSDGPNGADASDYSDAAYEGQP